MMDWELPSGRTARVEAVPVYCANCGKKFGLVPRENTTFSMYLCNKCYDTYGAVAGTFALPDDEFCKAVAYEMEQHYGRHLTDAEIGVIAAAGELPPALAALERDSPFPSLNNRPQGCP